MEFTTLGRTDMRVSVAGLGCGGHSRLGLSYGRSEAQAADIVRCALDQGISLIDTARGYGTEGAIGKALVGRTRSDVVLCTKVPIRRNDGRIDPGRIRTDLEDSLIQLKTECVDLLYLHGVAESDYDFAVADCLPVLEDLRRSGKLRFIGITESFSVDKTHTTLAMATRDPWWDVVMVGFNILNQTARDTVFPQTLGNNIGTTLMFAIRRALSRPDVLREVIAGLAADGDPGFGALDPENPLGFLMDSGVAGSVQEAAYRFCRHEPGVDCVLFGTGNPEHVRDNIASILGPPLPDSVITRLKKLFSGIATESGN